MNYNVFYSYFSQNLAARNKIRKCLCIAFMVIVIGNFFVGEVSAHGRLIEPPSRASMWRYGFDTPHDYNDHESYCGGFTRQWQRNNGKCGICGDAWDSRPVRKFYIKFLLCFFIHVQSAGKIF